MSDKRVAVGLAVLVSVLLLVGCSHPKKDPGPPVTATGSTTTPTSVVETTEPPDPAQVNIDDAIAAYRNYVDVQNSVSQNYFKDWRDKVLPLTSGDHADWVLWYFPQAFDARHHQTGADVVRSVTVSDYKEDPNGAGHEQIVLNACVDSTDVQELDPDGNNTLVPGTMGRFTTTIIMQHQTALDEQGAVAEDPVGQAWWRISGLNRDTGSAC